MQNDCFASNITSDPPGQRKWENKAEGGGACLRKAKACSKVPSRIPLRLQWSPFTAREARKAGVLAGYFATLNKTGMPESEEGGQDEYRVVKQQCLPHYKITFSQTDGIIGQVGTFEMAEHTLSCTDKGSIYFLLLRCSVPKPQLHFSALLGSAAHPLCPECEWTYKEVLVIGEESGGDTGAVYMRIKRSDYAFSGKAAGQQ